VTTFRRFVHANVGSHTSGYPDQQRITDGMNPIQMVDQHPLWCAFRTHAGHRVRSEKCQKRKRQMEGAQTKSRPKAAFQLDVIITDQTVSSLVISEDRHRHQFPIRCPFLGT
jgi:hypothetical protein